MGFGCPFGRLFGVASKLDVKVEPSDISVSHRLPTEKGHKQIIARFTHARKRTELLRATKKIKQVNDLRGVGISQDLTKSRGKVAYLARSAVRQGRIKKTSVWDGKIYITDNNETKHVITTESELYNIVPVNSNNSDTSNPQYQPPMPSGFHIRSPGPTFPMSQFQQTHMQHPTPYSVGPMYAAPMDIMQPPPTFH